MRLKRDWDTSYLSSTPRAYLRLILQRTRRHRFNKPCISANPVFSLTLPYNFLYQRIKLPLCCNRCMYSNKPHLWHLPRFGHARRRQGHSTTRKESLFRFSPKNPTQVKKQYYSIFQRENRGWEDRLPNFLNTNQSVDCITTERFIAEAC